MYVVGLEGALGASPDIFADRSKRHWALHGRPYVTLCYAQTIDGSTTLVRGTSMSISGPESGKLTHALRAVHDGILVGIDTILADDPLLTVRHVTGTNPRPVILDTRLRLPPTARVVREGQPWVYTGTDADAERRKALEQRGVPIRVVDCGADGHVLLEGVLHDLAVRDIQSLMVEGGATIVTAFLRLGLADRVAITIAPVFAGGYPSVGALGLAAVDLPRLRKPACLAVGGDFLLCGDLHP